MSLMWIFILKIIHQFYVNNSDGDTIFYNQRHLDKDNPIPHNLENVDRVFLKQIE